MRAQKASNEKRKKKPNPSAQLLSKFRTVTFGYPSVHFLHHSNKAALPVTVAEETGARLGGIEDFIEDIRLDLIVELVPGRDWIFEEIEEEEVEEGDGEEVEEETEDEAEREVEFDFGSKFSARRETEFLGRATGAATGEGVDGFLYLEAEGLCLAMKAFFPQPSQ